MNPTHNIEVQRHKNKENSTMKAQHANSNKGCRPRYRIDESSLKLDQQQRTTTAQSLSEDHGRPEETCDVYRVPAQSGIRDGGSNELDVLRFTCFWLGLCAFEREHRIEEGDCIVEASWLDQSVLRNCVTDMASL